VKYKYLRAERRPGELVEIDVKYVPGFIAYRRDYNEFRPHSALDNMTPEEYVKKHLKKPEISNLRGTALG